EWNPGSRARGHAFLLASLSRFFRRRFRRPLGPAVAARPGLAPARCKLLFLRELEPLARPSHRRLYLRGLWIGSRHGYAVPPARARVSLAEDLVGRERRGQPRSPLLFQICQLLP